MAIESVTFGNFTFENVEELSETQFYATREEDGEANKPRYLVTHAEGVVSKISLITDYSYGDNLFLG